MSNFPKLIPAFTASVVIDAPSSVGALSKGHALNIVPFAVNQGGIKSEPSYPICLNATFLHGSDFIRADPSGKHIRLDVHSYLKDESGAIVAFHYQGVINVTGGVAAVLGGKSDAKTTEFGDAFTQVQFETGDEKLKGLELKVFVGSGRFVVEGGKTTVEYKISEVAIGDV